MTVSREEATVRTTKLVGVIGGMGPAATVDFLRRIIDVTDARRDQDHIRLIVSCNPQVPDRTRFILGGGKDPRPVLMSMTRQLERAGADLLVMPCNTAHSFLPDLRLVAEIPIVDWPLIVAEAVAFAGVQRVGILATAGTMVSGVYARAFAEFGIREVKPSSPAQNQLMKAIYRIKSSGPTVESFRAIDDAISDLRSQQVEACVIGCSELSLACHDRALPGSLRIIDATEVVARRVVQLAGGRVRPVNPTIASRRY